MSTPAGVRLRPDGRAVVIIDQTRLPGELVLLEIETQEQMAEAILSLRVRGAPAIGVFAAYGAAVLAARAADAVGADTPFAALLPALREQWTALAAVRPTAVNLSRQLERMARSARALAAQSAGEAAAALRREAEQIRAEDAAMCRAISEAGLTLLRDGDTVLTHCNAGPLATTEYGTGLGPLLLGAERGMKLHALVDETRPLLQGARLTAWELDRGGVDVTLMCDNMASLAMRQGRVSCVFVGCDRMAANGDAANKIGTSGLAVLCAHYGVPFYVLLPSSTVDLTCRTGEDIPIEQRPEDEIRSLWYREPMAPPVRCWNPAFDVTDHRLITAVVTERGVLTPPYSEKLEALFS